MIREDIRNLGLDRVVVASCIPRMHELTLSSALGVVRLLRDCRAPAVPEVEMGLGADG